MYFFSPRHPTSTSAKRVNRTAGCGVWYGSAGDTTIMIGTEVIGYKTQLTFKTRGKEKKKTNGDWIMHEFHLHSSSDDTVFDDMVLCRIYMKKGKKSSQTNEEVDNIPVPAGEQEAVAKGHRVMKRKSADHREMGTYGLVYTKSSEQNTSSVSKFPPLLSCQESNVQSDMSWIDVAVFYGKLNVEEEEEGRRMVKRRRVKENGSMVADYNEKGTSGLANTESPSLSLLEDKHALVSYGDMEDFSSLTTDGPSCAVNFGDNEMSEAERTLEQWLSEEPELHQCLITVNNERENCDEVNNVESTMSPSSSIGGLQADLHLINELCMAPPTDDYPLTEFMESHMYFDVSDFRPLLSPTDDGESSALLGSQKEADIPQTGPEQQEGLITNIPQTVDSTDDGNSSSPLLESNEEPQGLGLLTSDMTSNIASVQAEERLQGLMIDIPRPVNLTECLDIQRDSVACRGELPYPPMLSDHELTILVTEAFPYMEECLEVDDLFL
ncbi:uncharacterized protein LOC109820617 [Asparagus officinalis]|uniref:uncharacterized protein LOC109820617 n=1 Tax=Asparagus officinalis TaxID=4686 RepID=UPI00098E1EB4|nr:uncharacterized protein LOC109820617 [Asparagus officinalis]